MNVIGVNTPTPEAVSFSDFVIKINKRHKEQTRVMLITNRYHIISIYHIVALFIIPYHTIRE
jgi:hypothetical protein